MSIKIDTYDLEDTGSGYTKYRELVKCKDDWCLGDWVQTEDHIKEVKLLEAENAELRNKNIAYYVDLGHCLELMIKQYALMPRNCPLTPTWAGILTTAKAINVSEERCRELVESWSHRKKYKVSGGVEDE